MINHHTSIQIIKAALLIGCFFMLGCENDVNEVRELGKKKPNVEEGRNINSYLSMNGKMRARLTAPLLLRFNTDTGKKTEFPNSLHVDFYNDSMKVESQLSAQYGRYLENENKVYLRDSVVAFNIKGDTLFCKEMYWDQTLQKFYSNKQVTISKGFRSNLFIGLDGMTCNQDLTEIHLFNMKQGSFFTAPPDTTAAK